MCTSFGLYRILFSFEAYVHESICFFANTERRDALESSSELVAEPQVLFFINGVVCA